VRSIGQGLFGLSMTPVMIVSAVVGVLFPPFLLLIIPGFIALGFVLFYKPRPKPATFESWWDENWTDFL